jgi:hypothetical protein
MPAPPKPKKLAAGTNGSLVVDRCQVCDSRGLAPVIFVGYLPPVNAMPAIGNQPAEQPAYDADVGDRLAHGGVLLGLVGQLVCS